MFNLDNRSEANLKGVHADLVSIVRLAIKRSSVNFIVTEGWRTEQRQKQLVINGKSKTMNSRHLTGHAVDLAPLIGNAIPWNDWSKFAQVADAMKQSAAELGIKIEWGGDWKTFKDGPHFQLPHKEYPA